VFRRIGLACGACLLMGTVLAACSSSSSNNTGSAVTDSTLVNTPFKLHVYAQTVVDDAPFYIALEDGYFKAQGLDVTYTPLPKTTGGLAPLADGQADMVIGGNYPTMLQADEGIPSTGYPAVPGVGTTPGTPAITAQTIAELKDNIRILVEGYAGSSATPDVMAVVVLPGSKIQSVTGLAHQKIAVNLKTGIQSLTLNATLEAHGVSPSEVTYEAIPFPAMVAALKSHEVDAADMLEPFLTDAQVETGAVVVADQLAGPTAGFPMSGVFTTNTFVQAHPQVALAFQRAMLEAQAVADSNRLAVEHALPTYIQSTKGAPSIALVAPLINIGNYPTSLDPVPLERLVSLMLDQDQLTSPLNINQVLYNP
jgi:NitT/TauT family transport system substrate-binding protein